MVALPKPTGHSHKLGRVFAVILLLIIILASVVLVSFGYFNQPSGQTSMDNLSPNEKKGLDFIQDVISLDTSKYNVSIRTFSAPRPSFATAQQLELAPTPIDYNLNSSLYSIKVTCTFTKDILTMCTMEVRNDTVSSLRQYRNLTEKVKDFLTNYQNFSNKNATNMKELLTNIDPAVDSSTMSGNLKLVTVHKDLSNTAFGDSYEFRWVYSYNGCDYPALVLGYRNGVFSAFKDERAIYSIGDTTINISQQQAANIALDAIKNYTYEMPGGIWISNFGVNGTNTYLAPAIRNSTYLYPCWTVIIYLNKNYPGSVSALVVYVWADSGQFFGTSSTYVPGYGELT